MAADYPRRRVSDDDEDQDRSGVDLDSGSVLLVEQFGILSLEIHRREAMIYTIQRRVEQANKQRARIMEELRRRGLRDSR